MKSSALLNLSFIFYIFFPYSLATPRKSQQTTRRLPPDILLLTGGIADIVPCGTYTITGCGNRAQSACLQVRELSLALEAVVVDAKDGVKSQHGYEAFFKLNASASFVTNILWHVILGLPRADLSALRSGDAHSPTLVCEGGIVVVGMGLGDPRIPAKALQQCYGINGPPAFFVRSSRFVVVCNKFWDIGPFPAAGTSTCATVSDDKFVGNSEDETIGAMVSGQQKNLVNYRRYHLLRELVDFYLDVVSLESSGNPYPAFDWNRCIQLNPLDARTNPSNYQLYAASEFSSMTRLN